MMSTCMFPRIVMTANNTEIKGQSQAMSMLHTNRKNALQTQNGHLTTSHLDNGYNGHTMQDFTTKIMHGHRASSYPFGKIMIAQ